MAIAVVNSNSNAPAAAATVSFDLPASIVAGNLLLLFVCSKLTTTTWTTPTGWNVISAASGNGCAVFWRTADGTEGASVSVTSSASERKAGACYQISGQSSLTPEATATSATTANPNPPSLTPAGWSGGNSMYVVFAGGAWTTDVTSYPTNYTNNQINIRGVNDPCLSIAQRVIATAAEDPGTFTQGSSKACQAGTVAIQEAALAYTLVAAAGSYALTGVAALQKISINAAVGAYALTGRATGWLLSMIAAAGSYTYTGVASFAGWAIGAVAGSYTYTGVAATLQSIRSMIASAGSYTYTGVASFAGWAIGAVAGSYTLSGVAALQKISMNAITGAYTLTGIDAVLSWGRFLVAAAGSYTLSGVAALQKISMNAITGAYTYTGVAATLQSIRSMIASAGTYVLTGVDARLGALRTLVAAAGTYVYTGVPAVLAKGVQNLAYRVRRVVDPVLAKVRASTPTLFKRRVDEAKLRKTRVSDPSLFK